MDHSDYGTEHDNTAPDSTEGTAPAGGTSEDTGSGVPEGVPVGGEGSTRISYDAPGSGAGATPDGAAPAPAPEGHYEGSYSAGSYSSGADDDDDDDGDYSTEYASTGSYSAEGYAAEPEEPAPEPINLINLAEDDIPSFGALMLARPPVFDSEDRKSVV